MQRQYLAVKDDVVYGKFTITCRRGKNGGWHARAKFRGYKNQGSFSLKESIEFLNKPDAIHWANTDLEDYRLQQRMNQDLLFDLKPITRTTWNTT